MRPDTDNHIADVAHHVVRDCHCLHPLRELIPVLKRKVNGMIVVRGVAYTYEIQVVDYSLTVLRKCACLLGGGGALGCGIEYRYEQLMAK